MNATLITYNSTTPNYFMFIPDDKPAIAPSWANKYREPNYQIVATDYNNYALAYWCVRPPIPFFQNFCITEWMWVLSRTRTVTDDQLNTWDAILFGLGLPTNKLVKSNQNGCTN
jgi:hypothetical protein